MFRQLLILSLLLPMAASAAEPRTWNELGKAEQAALAPLSADWNSMPARQREKLLVVARDFPTLSPGRQKLLHSRLRAWSRLTAEERQIARDNYRKIQALPKQDQASIRQQWLDSLCREFGRPADPEKPAP